MKLARILLFLAAALLPALLMYYADCRQARRMIRLN